MATINSIFTDYEYYQEQAIFKTKEEAQEFNQLIGEVYNKEFKTPSDISYFIFKNKLFEKYAHISGVVTFISGTRESSLVGGFHPRIYALLCKMLKITTKLGKNKVRFEPFANFPNMNFSKFVNFSFDFAS